ncbi:uncharacterized protein LOC120352707 isoform X1 [Nilaparvata lugens]|uniref:uncharacterized protein LOC120352707 isoform X1 n=1 Tax=Nilaparvata lugens TaxID=108931 RepID=UPI00193EA96D|nr:uncharacterized protein LOC120352707 isoform X1 [Nilaparvata lugens]
MAMRAALANAWQLTNEEDEAYFINKTASQPTSPSPPPLASSQDYSEDHSVIIDGEQIEGEEENEKTSKLSGKADKQSSSSSQSSSSAVKDKVPQQTTSTASKQGSASEPARLLSPAVISGDSVLLYLCNMIPKLKSRASKQGGSDQSTQSSGGSSSQSSGSKKKGKG